MTNAQLYFIEPMTDKGCNIEFDPASVSDTCNIILHSSSVDY